MSKFISDDEEPIANLKQELLEHRRQLADILEKWQQSPPDSKQRKNLLKQCQDRQEAVSACKQQLDDMIKYLRGLEGDS